mgnify:CR=1 FL=1
MDDEGEEKSAQAYQVIGRLTLYGIQGVSQKEEVRALNYFSDTLLFDRDFLPWPKS